MPPYHRDMTVPTVTPGVLCVGSAIPDPPFELMRDGETFTLSAGDVLLAEDTAGSGHRWRLIDDAPWLRLYVELE